MYPFSRRSDAGTICVSKRSLDGESPERRSFSTFDLICFGLFPVLRQEHDICFSVVNPHTHLCFHWFFLFEVCCSNFGSEVEGILGVRNYNLQCPLVSSVSESIVCRHHIVQGKVMRNELLRLKLP